MTTAWYEMGVKMSRKTLSDRVSQAAGYAQCSVYSDMHRRVMIVLQLGTHAIRRFVIATIHRVEIAGLFVGTASSAHSAFLRTIQVLLILLTRYSGPPHWFSSNTPPSSVSRISQIAGWIVFVATTGGHPGQVQRGRRGQLSCTKPRWSLVAGFKIADLSADSWTLAGVS